MYKRVLSEAPSTPSKKANQARFVISPIKQMYQNNSTTYVREIRDPIDHSLIAVTFEGVYDLRSFFNGYDTVKDDDNNDVKSPVSGMESNFVQFLSNTEICRAYGPRRDGSSNSSGKNGGRKLYA